MRKLIVASLLMTLLSPTVFGQEAVCITPIDTDTNIRFDGEVVGFLYYGRKIEVVGQEFGWWKTIEGHSISIFYTEIVECDKWSIDMPPTTTDSVCLEMIQISDDFYIINPSRTQLDLDKVYDIYKFLSKSVVRYDYEFYNFRKLPVVLAFISREEHERIWPSLDSFVGGRAGVLAWNGCELVQARNVKDFRHWFRVAAVLEVDWLEAVAHELSHTLGAVHGPFSWWNAPSIIPDAALASDSFFWGRMLSYASRDVCPRSEQTIPYLACTSLRAVWNKGEH